MLETTALGAAFLAGLGVGLWKSRDEVARSWKRDKTFTPRMPAAERSAHLAKWQKAGRAGGVGRVSARRAGPWAP